MTTCVGVRLSDEALTIARRSADPATLAQVLQARCPAIWEPSTARERLSNTEELLSVAERVATRRSPRGPGAGGSSPPPNWRTWRSLTAASTISRRWQPSCASPCCSGLLPTAEPHDCSSRDGSAKPNTPSWRPESSASEPDNPMPTCSSASSDISSASSKDAWANSSTGIGKSWTRAAVRQQREPSSRWPTANWTESATLAMSLRHLQPRSTTFPSTSPGLRSPA